MELKKFTTSHMLLWSYNNNDISFYDRFQLCESIDFNALMLKICQVHYNSTKFRLSKTFHSVAISPCVCVWFWCRFSFSSISGYGFIFIKFAYINTMHFDSKTNTASNAIGTRCESCKSRSTQKYGKHC